MLFSVYLHIYWNFFCQILRLIKFLSCRVSTIRSSSQTACIKIWCALGFQNANYFAFWKTHLKPTTFPNLHILLNRSLIGFHLTSHLWGAQIHKLPRITYPYLYKATQSCKLSDLHTYIISDKWGIGNILVLVFLHNYFLSHFWKDVNVPPTGERV